MQLFLVMKVMNLRMKVMRNTTKNTFHLWKCLCSPIREVTARRSLLGAGQTGSWLTTKCSHFLPSESVSAVSPQNGRTVGILITRVKLKLLEVTSRAGCGIPPWSRYKFPWLDDIPAAIAPTCHTPHCHAAVTWRACHEFHEHHARHRHGEWGNINDNTQQARGKEERYIYDSKHFWLCSAYWLMHVLTPDVSFIVYTLRSSCYQQTVHTWAVDTK